MAATISDMNATPRRMSVFFLLWLTDVSFEQAPLIVYPVSHRILGSLLERYDANVKAMLPYFEHDFSYGLFDFVNIKKDVDFTLKRQWTHAEPGTLAGIRREGRDRGRGQVEGLIWQDVERIAAFAEADKTIAGLRDSAMIRLMSDCLLRVSEVVAVDVEDVNKTTLTVRQSKTDQEGHGESLYVCKSTRQVIKQYQQKAGIERGALFRQVRRGDRVQSDGLTDFSARRIIQKRSLDAGIKGFISGHSLRVGSAVSLAQAGASVVDMQVAGRWKSPQMPAHYAKAELAERGAVARFFYGKGR